jgi:hypothetical protein
MLLVFMHEVPDLDHKGGIRRLDRYDELAEYVWGEWCPADVVAPMLLCRLWCAYISCLISNLRTVLPDKQPQNSAAAWASFRLHDAWLVLMLRVLTCD